MLSGHCPAVTLVYCGQTVGRIKMKLGTQVGLRPGHIALDGDPSSSPSPKGAQLPIFGPCLLAKRLHMDQDATWDGVGLGPGHIVLDGDPAPPHKKGALPPIFGQCLLWPNGWMDQDATWYTTVAFALATLCHMGIQLPPPKRVTQPQFSTHI